MGENNPLRSAQSPGDIGAIIFDLDGTLIDSSGSIAESLRVAFSSLGKTLPESNLRSAIGPPIQVISRTLLPSLTDDEVLAIEMAYRAEYDGAGCLSALLFEGVVEGLMRLRAAGLRIFIVTNKPGIPTRKILAHLGIDDVFEAIATRDSRKPALMSKGQMLAMVVSEHCLEPAGALMVGDTQEDQQAAIENGIRFVHVRYGFGQVPNARWAVNSFLELEHMLLRGEGPDEI